MKHIISLLARAEPLANFIFSVVLIGVRILLYITTLRFSFFRERIRSKNLTVEIKLKDNTRGRYFKFADGKVTSRRGISPDPEVTMIFDSARLALDILVPPRNQLGMVSAEKNFQLKLEGPEI